MLEKPIELSVVADKDRVILLTPAGAIGMPPDAAHMLARELMRAAGQVEKAVGNYPRTAIKLQKR